MVVYRCKADSSLEASMENGSFLLTSCSGTGFGENKTSGAKLYEFIHNETPTSFDPATGKTSWTLKVEGTPTGGSYKLGVNAIPTADIAYNATAAQIASAINGLSGVTGVTATATGTGTVTITLTPGASLSRYALNLTGGTNPNIVLG